MAKKQPAKLGDTVDLLRPYLERALHDEEFRNDLKDAMQAARELYGPLSKSGGVKGSAKTIATDRKTQEQLMKAMEEIAGAAGSLQGKDEEEEEPQGPERLLLAGIVAGALYNPWTGPQTREKLLDVIAGDDDLQPLEGFDVPAEAAVETDGGGRGRRGGSRRRRGLAPAKASGSSAGGRSRPPARARPGRGRSSWRCPTPRAGRPPLSDQRRAVLRPPRRSRHARSRRTRPRLAARRRGTGRERRRRRTRAARVADRMDLEVQMRDRAARASPDSPEEAEDVPGLDALTVAGRAGSMRRGARNRTRSPAGLGSQRRQPPMCPTRR